MYPYHVEKDGQHSGLARITVEKSVDSSQLNESLAAVMKESGVKAIIIDIEQVEFIESSGLGALVTAYKQCHQKGIGVVFANPQPYILKLVGITKLDQVLTLVDSDEKAIEHLFQAS